MVKYIVRDALAALKALEDERLAAIRRVTKAYDAAAQQYQQCLDGLKEEYKDLAFECAAQLAPFARNGKRLYPDGITVTEDGIEMEWDADHPYDIQTVEITWEELTAKMQEWKAHNEPI